MIGDGSYSKPTQSGGSRLQINPVDQVSQTNRSLDIHMCLNPRTQAQQVAGVDVPGQGLLEEVVERGVGVRHQEDALARAVGVVGVGCLMDLVCVGW